MAFSPVQSMSHPNLKGHKLSLLDEILNQIPVDLQPTALDYKMRLKIANDLQKYLRQTYPNALVHVFGSTRSGFCFFHSDIDVSVALRDSTVCKKPGREILELIGQLLTQNPDLKDIEPILGARVPIIKFKHASSNIPVDLSLYNPEGIHTTRLLHTYSQIDDRFKTLVYCLKVMVKLCSYDGFHGYFAVSTYTYLVIYYLQQKKPPVLPVLHELFQGEKPDLEEGDLDVYFYEDVPNLVNHWPEFGKNKESVGQLWLGFLRFYAWEFEPQAYVVSLRQLQPMYNTNVDKSRCIAVENPVEVGSIRPGLFKERYMDMINMFKNAHDIFANLDLKPSTYDSFKDYAFNPSLLTQSRILTYQFLDQLNGI